MTQNELSQEIAKCNAKAILIEAVTGYGKTYLAITKIAQLKHDKVLVVVPRNALKDNWKYEFYKFHKEELLKNVTFTTYNSLHKYAGKWDVVCIDECHHTTPRCQEILQSYTINRLILLSATIKRDTKQFFKSYSKYNYKEFKVNTHQAIEEKVLPNPLIKLLQLNIKDVKGNFDYEVNSKAKVTCQTIYQLNKDNYWKLRKNKNIKYIMRGTAQQYLALLDYLVDFYKRKSARPAMKNLWLFTAGERLKWLATLKHTIVSSIVEKFKKERILVFCESIEGSESIGIPSVNSKIGTNNLDRFNNRKIKHISAVGMLDEGVNLTECKIGIFQMINAAERLNVQRIGRILRHKEPVLIFPYFVGTREDQIVSKVTEGYDIKFVSYYTNINSITLN